MRRAIVFALFFTNVVHGQDPADASPRRLLQDYLLAECQAHFDSRRAEVAKATTPEAILARQKMLKAKFLDSLGPMPEKTPLNAQVVGTLSADGFRVEKVIYESRPNHHVTATLYLPNAKGRVPGVIVPCGHSANGKASEAYQRVSILLAKNGFAVLCFDPIGQGERRQLLKDDGKPGIPSLTNEHTLIGIGAWLVGQSTASYRIWDGIRSLDYLASRPEVDASKLGCAGNSGGGTMTAYLMALDDRIACAVPSCYITSLEKLFRTIGPQDAEQNIVGQVAFGMEHADYITLRAPRPTLMATATQDFFNIEGSRATFQEVSQIYKALGHADRVAFFEFNDKHGFSKPRREATVHWMKKWLLGQDEPVTEGDFPSFTDAQLRCTRSGQALTDFGGMSSFQLNIKAAEADAARRSEFVKLTGAERSAIWKTLGVSEPIPQYRGARLMKAGVHQELLFDGGVPLRSRTIPGDNKSKKPGCVIVLPERQLDAHPLTQANVDSGRTVVEVLVRGLGGPQPKGSPAYFSHDFGNAMLGLHLNRPLLGQRVADVRGVLRWAGKDAKEPVTLVAEGMLGPIALHAAALEPGVSEVVIDGGVVSWNNVVRTPLAGAQLANVVPGVLRHYDLPDLAATLAPRPLTLRGMVDASGKAMSVEAVEAAYRVCRQAYEKAGAGASLRIEAAKATDAAKMP